MIDAATFLILIFRLDNKFIIFECPAIISCIFSISDFWFATDFDCSDDGIRDTLAFSTGATREDFGAHGEEIGGLTDFACSFFLGLLARVDVPAKN